MPPARDTCCIVNVQLDAREVRAVFGHSHIRLVLASMIRAAVGTVVGGGVPHKCLRSDAPAIPAVWRWGAQEPRVRTQSETLKILFTQQSSVLLKTRFYDTNVLLSTHTSTIAQPQSWRG